MLAKFSGVKSERTVSKHKKTENETFDVVFTYSIKQRQLRNVQKSSIHPVIKSLRRGRSGPGQEKSDSCLHKGQARIQVFLSSPDM